MDFASSHAFIGEDAYEEIQEDVLAGDLLSNLDASGLEAEAAPAAAAAPAARSSFFGRSRSRSRSPARHEQAQAQSQQATNRSPSFLSRIFGSSSASSASSAAPAPAAPAAPAPAAPAPVAAAPPSGAAYGAPGAPPSQPQIARKRAVFQTQADTNVAAIKFGTLAEQAHQVFAGDPIFCSAPSCGACLNAESVLLTAAQWKQQQQQQQQEQKHAPSTSTSTDALDVVMNDASAASSSSSSDSKQREPSDDELVWRCEFCSHINILDAMDDAERPTGESRDYVLVPAPAGTSSSDEKNGGDAAAGAGGAVIFVIDISGSMCSTSEVPGSFKLKGVKNNAADFDIPMAADERIAPQRRRADVTYVSRLQCVSAAIDAQIEAWSKQHPNKQVGLVTFNNEVTIIGDGTKPEEIVTGDKLRNDAVLREIGSKHGIQSAQPISVTAANLSKKLFSLEEKGQTALGPALLIATAMANQRVGSTVIVCTDGLANQGVGALDQARTEEEKLAVEAWYEGVGTIAKSAGTTISVITIAGAEARLEDLSIAVNLTGGTVDRVDPLQLTQNFGSILANPVIATQVSATFLLHKGLKFRNHVAPAPTSATQAQAQAQAQQPNAENKMHKEIGAVSADTEITFEYEVRNRAALAQYKDANKLPFQVQIHYTKLNGMKCLRVISKSQSLTASRDVAERSARLDLLAANVAQSSSRMAEKGDYGQARAKNLAWGKLMKRAANVTEVAPQQQQQVYSNWLGETAVFDRSLHVQQAQLSSVNNNDQDEDEDGSGAVVASSAPRAERERAARGMRDDRQYAEIHKFKAKSSAAYSRPPNK